MDLSNTMKWLTGAFELLLGIPVLGATIVLGFGYGPLGIMLILHIITLLICRREMTGTTGSIFGIVTSIIAVIPFVGMVMHLITGCILLVDAARSR